MDKSGSIRLSKLSSTSSPEKKKDSYEDLMVQVMKKFGSHNFSTEEFVKLDNNCMNISMYLSHLMEEEATLTSEV